jgi:hypothetical protein
MKHRSKSLSIYKNFSAMIHTHFDTSIRVFRVDSAGEYLSDALCQVLAEQGTLAQFSYPGAHAQNGVTEHKHHHLLETAHALMITSSIPPHFWAEAVSTATYLINIQPSSTIQGGIPFEHLCGKTLDYSSLHLFGCVCYVLLAPHERTKLTSDALRQVLAEQESIVFGIRSLLGCEHHGMLSLMSPVFSIRIPPLMPLMHLWLTLCLTYFSLMLLLILYLFLARLYRPLCLPLSLLL